jgi:hypothetical protein
MINSQKFYYKKEIHTEIAEELNRLASDKNVQVSRWVNNSKGRQIVTYMKVSAMISPAVRKTFCSKPALTQGAAIGSQMSRV